MARTPASSEKARPRKFRFGAFSLDLSRGTLRASGRDIKLRPQTFEVLSILADRSGELVSKDELIDTVWRGTPVTDDSLTQCIVEIRKAIGDDSHTIIRTVPKRGFIFDPPASTSAISPGNGEAPPETLLDRLSIKVVMGVAAVAVIMIAAMLTLEWNPRNEPDPVVTAVLGHAPPNSVAVLPFVDMSQDGDQQYFGDGLADEILSSLAAYPELIVIARTSSFLFRDKEEDVMDMGRRLNAAHVLQGSIRKAGNRVRITARLIETRGSTQVWSKPFDRELTVENLLDIQAEVAASVAESIASGASRFDRRDIVRSATNAEAYDRYLEGMFHLRQVETSAFANYDLEIYEAAIERFKSAIELDPDWALPHIAIGRTMVFRAGILLDYEDADAYEWYGGAKTHLLEAIRLDANNAVAYSFLGHVLLRLDFDFPAAAAAHTRARELGGYFPWRYALYLRSMGQFDEAIEQYLLAIERDPLSAGPRHQLATTYRCAGRFADSIAELEKTLRLAPTRDDLYLPLTYLYLKTGDLRRGSELFAQIDDPESTTIMHAQIYVLLGMTERAYAAMAKVEKSSHWRVVQYAGTGLALGDQERVLSYLEAAYKEDPRILRHVLCIDGIKSLAGNPRYQQMLRQAGFPSQLR